MLNSKNLFVGLISLIALMTKYFGVELPNTPEAIVDSAAGLGFVGIITSVVIPNFMNVTIKLIQNWNTNGFNWGFLKSPNFLTGVTTIVMTLLDGLGVTNSLVIAIIVNAINISWHIIFDTLLKNKPMIT